MLAILRQLARASISDRDAMLTRLSSKVPVRIHWKGMSGLADFRRGQRHVCKAVPVSGLLHFFDIAEAPGFVEPGLKRAIQAEKREPALLGPLEPSCFRCKPAA